MPMLQRTLGIALVLGMAAAVVPLPDPLPEAALEAAADGGGYVPVIGNCDQPVRNFSVIRIVNNDFDPDPATVPNYAYVSWRNDDLTIHTTTEADHSPPLWDSGNMLPGGRFTAIFCEAGTYNYFCEVHGFTGVLEIVAA